MNKNKTRRTLSRGGRNLVLLGIISVVIAVATTGVSLLIYHNSGDIYLDRSRPGYLPEEGEDEDENKPEEEYSFDKNGKITMGDVEAYLENLNLNVKAIDAYEKPFDAEVLSDKSLGIPGENNT